MSAALSSRGETTHWYPTENQVANPRSTAQAFRILLDQFYTLQGQHNALREEHNALKMQVSAKASGPPPGSGPADTILLGLHVEPVDTNSLANGTALKFNKARGTFSFQ